MLASNWLTLWLWWDLLEEADEADDADAEQRRREGKPPRKWPKHSTRIIVAFGVSFLIAVTFATVLLFTPSGDETTEGEDGESIVYSPHPSSHTPCICHC